jgi:hypothetical protein
VSAPALTAFETYRKSYLAHLSQSAQPEDFETVKDIFARTHEFLATESLTTGNADPGCETLDIIPSLSVNRSDAYGSLEVDKLSAFIEACKVPMETRLDCALEVARILSGATSKPQMFVDKGRANAKPIPMSQVYGAKSIAMVNKQAAQALESFGEYSDRVTSDSRLAVALTVLRAHRSLIDRVLPRRAAEDPVVIIKIPSPEVYDLDLSQNPKAAIRTKANRQPLIELYRDPSAVNTTPQQIKPLKVNDVAQPAGLIADNVIAAGQKVNLFDLTLSANTVGYQAVDWTDLVSDGGSVGSILLQATRTVAGAVTIETYALPTQYLRSAAFVTQTNVTDSGDRAANLRSKWVLNSASLVSGGTTSAGAAIQSGAASTIFSTFVGVNAVLEINFNADLNIKTANTNGSGTVAQWLDTTLPSGVPAAVQTVFGQTTFQVIGWTPYLFFSEENMRKTTGAVRMNFKEIEFLIPVGRNFIVDYSLMNQEIGEEVTNVVSEVINIGNSARSVTIINDVLTAVGARLAYEASNPDIDFYSSVAQDYAAGTLSLPHVYVGALDVSHAAVMRESERLSDLHSYVTSRLLALIADAHNKSMYTENFEPGERARYKVITSGPIAEILFGITQYWNTLDDRVTVAKDSSYSLKLLNGTQLDIIKSNFEFFANTMIIIPVREAKPDDVTSFGTILDRGTFVGQYTPVSNGAANKRIVANSREILFPTNPLGFLITIQNLDQTLNLLAGATDGPSLM